MKKNKKMGIKIPSLLPLLLLLLNLLHVHCYTATALFGGMNSKCSDSHYQQLLESMKKGLQ